MTDSQTKAREITDKWLPCWCHEAYTTRGLVAPDCPKHQFADDIAEDIAAALDEARVASASNASDVLIRAIKDQQFEYCRHERTWQNALCLGCTRDVLQKRGSTPVARPEGERSGGAP